MKFEIAGDIPAVFEVGESLRERNSDGTVVAMIKDVNKIAIKFLCNSSEPHSKYPLV